MSKSRAMWWLGGLCAGVPCAVLADVPTPAKVAAAAPVAATAPSAPAPIALTDLEVDAGAASSSAAWEAIKLGKMTPEDAWKKGLFDAADVQAGLVKGLAGGEDQGSRKLRVLLGGVLVQHAPEVVADALKRPRQVQHVLADYYGSVGDEKAVPLYESVLKQTPAFYEQGLLLNDFGAFWAVKGQPQKAQEVFERGYKVLKGKTPMFAAEMLLWSGHAWARAGDWDKANAFYERVPAEGDSLMTGLVVSVQARHLMDAGKSQEALVLLQGALAKDKGPIERAAHLSGIAQAFYAQHNLAQAQKYARLALLESAKQPNVSPSIGLGVADSGARAVATWSQVWQKKPVQVVPERVRLEKPWKEGEMTVRLSLRTLWPMSYTLASSNPYVGVRLVAGGWTGQRPLYFEQEVQAILPASLFQGAKPPVAGETLATITLRGRPIKTVAAPSSQAPQGAQAGEVTVSVPVVYQP